MPRYIVNITQPDGSDSVTLTDFAHEAAFVASSVIAPHEVRRIEDGVTRQEWFGEDIRDFIAFYARD